MRPRSANVSILRKYRFSVLQVFTVKQMYTKLICTFKIFKLVWFYSYKEKCIQLFTICCLIYVDFIFAYTSTYQIFARIRVFSQLVWGKMLHSRQRS